MKNMASTFDNKLRLREMGTGDESGTWEIVANKIRINWRSFRL